MKKLFTIILVVFVTLLSYAQHNVSGTFTNDLTGEPVSFATIELDGNFRYTAQTDVAGYYFINAVATGQYKVQITRAGFAKKSFPLIVNQNQKINISLSPSQSEVLEIEILPIVIDLNEFTFKSTRASDQTPMSYAMVEKEDIEKKNLGQDLPTMLEHTPSIVTTSDAGAGVGYTGLRLRGSDFSRINMTINGIPYNDSESQGIFLVNLPDFASSVEDIQIQRGVGTSTNGSGAFGGSINIKTAKGKSKPWATIANSIGSFGTMKNTIAGGTGYINKHWTFDGRLSRVVSDGYIDRSSVDLESYYLSAGYISDRAMVKFNNFSGNERTNQAWNGSPEARINGSRADIIEHYNNNKGSLYNTIEDSINLFKSDRRYNYYTYEDEIDLYQQNHYQLITTYQINGGVHLNGAIHYTKGSGYFEQFKFEDDLADYGIEDVIIGQDTIANSDIIRRRWLDNDFYGFSLSSNIDLLTNTNFVIGTAWNQYAGEHFGEVTWARYAGKSNIGDRYYENDALKTDFNIFTKADYRLTDEVVLFGDLQYRNVGYNFLGFNENANAAIQNVVHHFFNPKIGGSYQYNNYNKFYASFAVANREPTRDDYTNSSTVSRPKAERLNNVELGWHYSKQGLKLSSNIYIMDYKNQLVLNGKINDVGEFNRQNVDQSSRVGLEVDGAYKINEQWKASGNITLSRNNIKDYQEYIFNYVSNEEEVENFSNTNIAFSPSVISGLKLDFAPKEHIELSLLGKYVGRQYLDNTTNENRSLDPYFVTDVLASYRLKNKFFKEITFNLKLNNLFSVEYVSNGYTYSYKLGDDVVTENFLYPQATRNILAGISINF